MSFEAFTIFGDIKKWCAFYPLKKSIFFEEEDDRNPDEILLQEKIYGKACVGSCGFQPVWIYNTWDKKDVRLKKI